MKLTGRTILITGGTSGIGLALAKQLLGRGNTVIVTGRDASRLAATARDHADIHTLQSDVSDPQAIRVLAERVLREFPALDTLINNAGIMRNLRLTQDRSLEDVTRELETNLSGPMRMIQQFLPHLSTRPGALIVNVTSGLAFVPFPASPVYCAAKAGLHSYTQTLRTQLAGKDVTVVELAPPMVETSLLRGEFEEEMKGEKGMNVEVLARRALAGLEAGRLEIRPGLSNVLKMMSRVAPGFMFKQMTRLSRLQP